MSTDRSDAPLPAVEELLGRLGVEAGGEEPLELAHNRRLTPGVWRVRTGEGRTAVLKYLRADRDPGDTAWDGHWSAEDQDVGSTQ